MSDTWARREGHSSRFLFLQGGGGGGGGGDGGGGGGGDDVGGGGGGGGGGRGDREGGLEVHLELVGATKLGTDTCPA